MISRRQLLRSPTRPAAVRQETAALRDFGRADDRCGSFASDRNASDSRGMSASPRKRPLASKRNPARGHPLAGLVQHSAGLHGVIAAQRLTAGLDRPTIPKLALALHPSVMTITKERISPFDLMSANCFCERVCGSSGSSRLVNPGQQTNHIIRIMINGSYSSPAQQVYGSRVKASVTFVRVTMF
jgi:hypothetical protein